MQRWQRPLPLRPTVGPLKLGDSLIVSGLDPLLRAYSARTGVAGGELSAAGDLAGPPRMFENAEAHRTELIVVTRDIAKGASVVSLTKDNRTGDPGLGAAAQRDHHTGADGQWGSGRHQRPSDASHEGRRD